MIVEGLVVGLGVVIGQTLGWLLVIACGGALIVEAARWARNRNREQTPGERLSSMREPGERLLLEARLPQTVATAAQIDEFMDRVGGWVDRVTAILIADDDRERLDKWTRVGWHRGRPQPRDSFEAQQYLVGPISERLTMLEGFCRDRSDAPQ